MQGEAGAKSYLVAPNTTVQLWDSENQVIYLKSADASGMPSIKTLDYTIREMKQTPASAALAPAPVYATKDELDALREELDLREQKNIGGKAEERGGRIMANPLFTAFGGGGGMNPLAVFQQLRANPLGLLRQFGFNVPDRMSGPDAIIQYLMNSGQVSQSQYEQARQMAQSFKF